MDLAPPGPRLLALVDQYRRALGMFDREAEIARTNREIACRGPGCCGCCHQIVTVQSFEAVVLALGVMQDPGWPLVVQGLALASRPFLDLALTHQRYFQGATLCCFGATGSCGVYRDRPIMCRYFYVVGHDPRVCWPPGGVASPLDLRGVVAKARQWARAAAQALAYPDLMAPLAPMVLWALGALGDPGQQDAVAALRQNFPDVVQWSEVATARHVARRA